MESVSKAVKVAGEKWAGLAPKAPGTRSRLPSAVEMVKLSPGRDSVLLQRHKLDARH